jgi:hypothetical protein
MQRRGAVASPIVHRLGERRLGSVLAAAGLVPLSVVNYGFNLVLPPFDSRFPRFAIGTQRRLARIARGPLRRLATDYMIVARRGAVPNVRA